MARRPVDVVAAVAFAGMGVTALARPATIPSWMGLTIADATGASEVRAVYGGYGLVMAASLLVGGATHRAGARRAAGLALLGMAAGRMVDVALGGRPRPTGVVAMAGEAGLGTALLLTR